MRTPNLKIEDKERAVSQEPFWDETTHLPSLFIRKGGWLVLGIFCFERLPLLGLLFWMMYGLLCFLARGRFQLEKDFLRIQKPTQHQHISLQTIGRVSVSQSPLDRMLRTGRLQIQFEKGETPLMLKDLKKPYEGWKQIKIAVARSRGEIL